MPTCKYCQEHISLWDGGGLARMHSACRAKLETLEERDQEALLELNEWDLQRYHSAGSRERREILDRKRARLEKRERRRGERSRMLVKKKEHEKAQREAARSRARIEKEEHEKAQREAALALRTLSLSASEQTTHDYVGLRLQIATIARAGRLSTDDVSKALRQGWRDARGRAFTQGHQNQDSTEVIKQSLDRVADREREFLKAIKLSDGNLTNEHTEAQWDDYSALAPVLEAAAAGSDEIDCATAADQLANSRLYVRQRRAAALSAWRSAVRRLVDDGILTTESEEALAEFLTYFDLEAMTEFEESSELRMFIQATTLRRSLDGDFLDLHAAAREHDHQIPFNLLKSETLVLLGQGAHYSTVETRREFRGSSHGLSIRLARGLYYRPSSFAGRSVTSEQMTHVDTGMLGITTKHLYFHGPAKRFRVRYDKIVSFEPYSDGLGFMRDNLRAKPETFTVGEDDGWFLYNLVTNLAQR